MQNTNTLSFNVENVDISILGLNSKTSKFDFSLQAQEKENYIQFDFEYCTKLFKVDTIKRLTKHYLNILESIVNSPEIKLSEINILTAKEKKQLLTDFNNTKVE